MIKDLRFRNKYKRGQAMMVATMFFLVVSITIIFGLVGPIVRQQKISGQLLTSRQSYFLAEAGIEDVVYRLVSGETVDASEVLTLGGSSATTVSTDTALGKEILATGDVLDLIRKVEVNLTLGVGSNFHYGVQVGNGGLEIGNATVNGNVVSNGPIVGDNGATITGSAFSTGASGLIDNVEVASDGLGEAWANTVRNSIIGGSLYCETGSGNNKPCDTSRSDPESAELPLSIEQIDEWKEDALAGGSIGSYDPSTDASLGPKKINGDLTLDNSNLDFTITGVIHVTGNIDLSNNQGSVKCDPSFGVTSCILIADGWIHIRNNITFSGSGQAGSYLLLISTLDCDGSSTTSPTSGKACGHHNTAVDAHNNSDNSLIYAPNGKFYLHQNVTLTEATAYKIELENNAVVNYEQGVANAYFSSGPAGGYELGEWKEVE